ncbi:hypothetical protein BD289DRAFT_242730 [Coniella lustricola]|uniref:Uncharacterized protein n=1 Tax=Coniella lustricola TaxID=2025994 RepID=A0A2T3A9F7_9PEZI|nr:hypothetical protein BD289DRAFT_242730 [Coniella lustricola]
MREARKYTEEEIQYVLERLAAGWQPRNVALQFKIDHPEWNAADKIFGSKQVSYIKTAYCGAPGEIKPFSGQEPDFGGTLSQSRHQGVQKQSIEKAMANTQYAGYSDGQQSGYATTSAAFNIASASTVSQQTLVQHQQRTPVQHQQQTAIHCQQQIPVQSQYPVTHQFPGSAVASDLLDSLFTLGDFGFLQHQPAAATGPSGNLLPSIPPFGHLESEVPLSPLSLPPEFQAGQHDRLASALAPFQNINNGPASTLDLNVNDLEVAMKPPTTNSDHVLPGIIQPKISDKEANGMWHAGPHDACLIHSEHRHDDDGGIYFPHYEAYEKSNDAVRNLKGYDVLFGMLSAMQTLQRDGSFTCNHMLCIQAREAAQRFVDTRVPSNHPLRYRPLKVPSPEVIATWMECNLRLPKGWFYDPFSDAVYPVDTLPGDECNKTMMNLGMCPNHFNAEQLPADVLIDCLSQNISVGAGITDETSGIDATHQEKNGDGLFNYNGAQHSASNADQAPAA